MREYVLLIDFMRDLGAAIQGYLPESERSSVPDLKIFLESWTSKKSIVELYRLRSDIKSYLFKHAVGDYSVDELFFYYDIGFVQERFGSDDPVFLAGVVHMLDTIMALRKAAVVRKYFGWIGFK